MKCITLSSGKQVCFDSTPKAQVGGHFTLPKKEYTLDPVDINTTPDKPNWFELFISELNPYNWGVKD